MPQPGLPPTPGSSSDIKGQDGSHHLSALHLAFELPPPAIHDAARTSPPDYKNTTHNSIYPNPLTASPNAPFPMQAAEAVKNRRRSSATRESGEAAFALPPPPTRSRKIIQMKPKPAVDDEADKEPAKSTRAVGKSAAQMAKTSNTPSKETGKKKQPSATSAAGRKIARKTAHSLIERRRRSKMNEEFALLKSMIPACTGEMHKLAILQASIEYLRYLEDCVSKLKAQHDDHAQHGANQRALPSISEFHPTFRDDDVEMSDPETASPTFTGTADRTAEPTPSPALPPQDARHRKHSYSSVSTEHRHYSFSATTSPAFGPQQHNGVYAPSNASGAGSALTSPALGPQSDLDQEATAALLMLNSDRRGAVSNGRGLSVRDLLSS